jgi:hypothetical protein
MEQERPFAVEISVSQAKRLGWSSNLYILDGYPVAYATSNKEATDSICCEITTRQHASKRRYGYLEPTTFPVEGLTPRQGLQYEWEQHGQRWHRRP